MSVFNQSEYVITGSCDSLYDLAETTTDTLTESGIHNQMKVLIKLNHQTSDLMNPLEGLNPNHITDDIAHRPLDMYKAVRIGGEDHEKSDDITTHINRHTVMDRSVLSSILSSNSVARTVISAHRIKEIMLHAGAISVVAADQANEYLEKECDRLAEHLEGLNNQLIAYSEAPGTEKAGIKAGFKADYAMMNQRFNALLNMVSGDVNSADRAVFHSTRKLLHLANTSQEPADIDLSEMISLGRNVRNFKVLGGSMIALEAGFDVPGILKAYDEGKNWEELTSEDIMEMVGSYGIGFLFSEGATLAMTELGVAALLATPVGWIIVIGLGVVGATLGERFGNDLNKGLWNKFDEYLHVQ